MKKRAVSLILTVLLATAFLAGCESKPAAPAPTAAPAPVTLTIAAAWPDCRAVDEIAKRFVEQYPNVTIKYEYLQDYYPSLEKRLAGAGDVDLFFTGNLQPGSALQPYALNLYALNGFELSNTFDGLIENFMYREQTADGGKALYAIPLGAEMRGLFVNTTLLNSLGIAVPTDQQTLLAACETLKQHGYIPFQGNPGNFAQTLIYPWVCNLIANAPDKAAAYEMVNKRESGTIELLKEPLTFLYTLVEQGYYDYKTAQTELSLFVDASDEGYARDFLNIKKQGDAYAKADDLGVVAFMPSPISMENIIAKAKDDYHSRIEYVCIPAPVSKDGGFAYLSPAHGIAVSNTSKNTEWAVKFLDFLFTPENNKVFAKAFGIVPNTKDAFSYILSSFNTPDGRISHLGQVTFDYDFYNTLRAVIVDLSKANNPKYMLDDGAGGLRLKTLDEFLAQLEDALAKAE